MKTLHLTLKKKWFNMIEIGEKKEEYRDIKNYWVNRLLTHRNIDAANFPWAVGYYAGTFSHVEFRNGYAKNAPKMRFKAEGIMVNTGRQEWGAEPGKKYFVIKLGERID